MEEAKYQVGQHFSKKSEASYPDPTVYEIMNVAPQGELWQYYGHAPDRPMVYVFEDDVEITDKPVSGPLANY